MCRAPLGKQEATDNRSRSVRHEKRLEALLGADTTPNSGSRPFASQKGDLHGREGQFLWEAKLTKGDRFTITAPVLMKAYREACQIGRDVGLEITMEGLPEPLDKDWVLIPAHLFRGLVEE